MDKPKKVLVIGLDCALTHLIDKHIEEGYLPTFKKLFSQGAVLDNAMVPFPTITPPNWATIGTGAWPGTHGVTDFWVPVPGKTPNNANSLQAFSSERVKAEFLWDAADKAGKKSIVLNFPGSWPSHMKNGIMIGGSGLCVGNYSDGLVGLTTTVDISGDMLITTGVYPGAVRGAFTEALGWAGLPDDGEPPMELSATLNFPAAKNPVAETTWRVLARQSGGDGYDQVSLCTGKDLSTALCTLKVGQWSEKIVTTMAMADGSQREVFFRAKLVEMSEELEEFRLYLTSLSATSGWSDPPEIAAEINSKTGVHSRGAGMGPYTLGWLDADTYVECNEYYSAWLADAAETVMKNHEWDLFFMHSHPPDWIYHAIMTYMDEKTCQDPAKTAEGWDIHRRVYESQDEMIRRIMEAAGEDCLVVLVSDHGATPDGPMFDPNLPLIQAGLTVYAQMEETQVAAGKFSKYIKAAHKLSDPAKSKAMPQRSCYIYVNLEGRDPEGIVKPEDYEKVQQEIIDALYAYVDPETGKRPVALALAKQDARVFGLYGDAVGDVVYAIYPEFGSQHGAILPTAKFGVGSLHALFSFTGPGIKKGARLQRSAWITDMVPTICYLMDLPVPETADGAVLYQIFENPNFKRTQIDEMKAKLAEMEKQLA